MARLASKGPWVPIGKGLVRAFLPIKLVAMDITNNCNLRCPFCVTDYSGIRRTFNMEQSVYERLLELVPFVRDEGHFWLSCGNEPTLHPKFLDFIDLVPLAFRKKVAFCTNLARPLKDDYLERLANSGVFRISISMDSMSDPSFTLLRRGGRLRIFRDNIERFAKHLQASAAPPKIEVITMGFKSNYDEIPDMIRWTQENLNAFDHSVRYAWQAAHQDQAFMEREQLDHADWDRLEARLAREGLKYSLHPLPKEHEQVPLDYKVPVVPRGEQKAAPRPLDLSVRWDGSIEVNGFPFSGENQLAHKFGVFKAGDTNEHLIDYLSRF